MKDYVLFILLISVLFSSVTGMKLPGGFSMNAPNEMMTNDSQVPQRFKDNVKKNWKLQNLSPLLQKGKGMKLPGGFSMIAPNEIITSDSQVPEHIKGNVKKSRKLPHLKLLLQKGKGMKLPGRYLVTAPNEMMTNDRQESEHIKGNVKKSWMLQHLNLLQKVKGLWSSKSHPITRAPYQSKSTALFFDYDDTDTDRLAQISRFIGESPKLKLKVPLNVIIRIMQISGVVLLILFLLFQIFFWRCCHYYLIKQNKRSLYYLSWR